MRASNGPVAQLVECSLGMRAAPGSNPGGSIPILVRNRKYFSILEEPEHEEAAVRNFFETMHFSMMLYSPYNPV